MKQCTQCGAQLDDDVKVCPYCGAKFAVEEKEAAPAAQPAPAPAAEPAKAAETSTPLIQLPCDRNLLKWILFGIITFGIYNLVVMTKISGEINIIASKYDAKRTMNYCLVTFIFSWLTFGIVPLIWYHRISERIGDEVKRRGYSYEFGAGTFWGWGILGSLIIVGPYIYTHKLLNAMNIIAEDFNKKG